MIGSRAYLDKKKRDRKKKEELKGFIVVSYSSTITTFLKIDLELLTTNLWNWREMIIVVGVPVKGNQHLQYGSTTFSAIEFCRDG